MLEIINHSVHLVNGRELVDGTPEEQKAKLSSMGLEARDDRNGTIAFFFCSEFKKVNAVKVVIIAVYK